MDGLRRAGSEIVSDGGDVQPRDVHWFQLYLEPYGSLNVGAEFLYGWAMEQSGLKANAPRTQFSAKYSFVKVDADK